MIKGTLNINSLSSKFDDLKVLISGTFDILIITETKLDDTYPISQFHIDGYSMPYRPDRNRNGGGVIIYVRVMQSNYMRDDIPSKVLRKHLFPNDIEVQNSRVTKSSYETELRKMTSHFELLTRSRKIKTCNSRY